MAKPKKDKNFVKGPSYPGGPTALKEFVKKNLVYPKEAKKEKIEGSVHLKYDVNYKGDVIGTKVIIPLGYGCDEEAIRIVKLLKFKVPKSRKIKVIFHKSIRIHFKLKKTKKAAPLNVNYILSNSKQPTAKSSSDSGYTYSIKY